MTMRPAGAQRGVAAIELAIVAVFILLPIAYGVTELGRAFYQYNTLVKVTRAAARDFVLGSPALDLATRTQRALCLAVFGHHCEPGAGTVPVVEGLTQQMVLFSQASVTFSIPGGGSYPYTYVCATINGADAASRFTFTPYIPLWIGAPMTFGPIRTCLRYQPA